MSGPRIEHVNVTVSDPERTASLMGALFGWHIRWRGPARDYAFERAWRAADRRRHKGHSLPDGNDKLRRFQTD